MKKQNIIMIVIIAIIAVVVISVGVKLHQGGSNSTPQGSMIEQEGSLSSDAIEVGQQDTATEEMQESDNADSSTEANGAGDNAVTNSKDNVSNKDASGNSTSNDNSSNSASNSSNTNSSSSSNSNSNSNSNTNSNSSTNSSSSGNGNTSNSNSGSNSSNSGNSSSGDNTSTPVQPEEETITVYVTIRCDTILNNMDKLKEGTASFVPSSGYIMSKKAVELEEGATAYDATKKACSNAGVQIEFSWTPAYNTYYCEGINNIYEFDCGPDSGWMYKVNGNFPNYGCSQYEVTDGDQIVWCYSCEGLGADVGASY